MTALSAAYEAERKDGEMVSVPVKAAAVIYKGGLVVDKGTGYAEAGDDGSGYTFLGVAVEGATGNASTDGLVSVRVYKTGSYKYTLAGGASQTNLGVIVYVSDDQTVGTTSTNSIACGYVAEVIDSTYVRVRIDLSAH